MSEPEYDPSAQLPPEARAALMADRVNKRPWYDFEPRDATQFQLPDPEIWGPLTEYGGECPWPWEPQQLQGVPMGQYRCPYCGAMCMAGIPHLDYKPGWDEDDLSEHLDGPPAPPEAFRRSED